MQQFWNEKYAPKCRLRDVLKVCTPDFFHHYLLGSAPLHFADSLLSYLIPSHSVLYCDILFNPATSYHIQYCTIILYSTLLYSTLLYSTLLYSTVFHTALFFSAPHSCTSPSLSSPYFNFSLLSLHLSPSFTSPILPAPHFHILSLSSSLLNFFLPISMFFLSSFTFCQFACSHLIIFSFSSLFSLLTFSLFFLFSLFLGILRRSHGQDFSARARTWTGSIHENGRTRTQGVCVCVWGRERERVCVCVGERERMRERERENECVSDYVFVCERERLCVRVWVSVCVWVWMSAW